MNGPDNLADLVTSEVVSDGVNINSKPTAHLPLLADDLDGNRPVISSQQSTHLFLSAHDVCFNNGTRLGVPMPVINSESQPTSLTSDYHSGHFDLSPACTDSPASFSSSPSPSLPSSRSCDAIVSNSTGCRRSLSGHGSDPEALGIGVSQSYRPTEASKSCTNSGCTPHYRRYRRRRTQARDHSLSIGNISTEAAPAVSSRRYCPLSRNCWSSTSSFSVSTSSFFSEDDARLRVNDISADPDSRISGFGSIDPSTVSQSMSALQLAAASTPATSAPRSISSSSLSTSVANRSAELCRQRDSAWTRTCSTVPQLNSSARRKYWKCLSMSPSLSTPDFSNHSQSYSSLQGKWKGVDHLERSVDTSRDSVFSPDNFARAIRPTYQYLMRTGIVSPDISQYDSDDKMNDELTWDTTDVPELGPSRHHSYSTMCLQYKCLTEWLDSVCAGLYMCSKSSVGLSFRQSLAAEMDQKRLQRHLFEERCRHLLKLRPDLEADITDRINHLEQKWTELTAEIDSNLSGSSHRRSDRKESGKDSTDMRLELATLEVWLQQTEERMKPVSFHRNRFTSSRQLDQTLTDYKTLLEEIKSRQAVINKAKQLEPAEGASADLTPASDQLLELDERWLKLLLRAHEWVYYLENCATVQTSSESGDSSCEDYCESGDYDHPNRQTGITVCESASSDCLHFPHPSVFVEPSEISDTGSFIEDDYLMDTSRLEDMTTSSTNPTSASTSTPKPSPTSVSSPSSRTLTLKVPLTSTPMASVSSSDVNNSFSTVLAYDLEPPDRGYSSNNSACGNSGESEGEPIPARAAVNSSNVRCEVVKALDEDEDDVGSERLSDSSLSPPNSDCVNRISETSADPSLSSTSPPSSTLSPSSFSVSDRRADNLATFYFRHVESPTLDDCAHFRASTGTDVTIKEDSVSASAYAAAILNRRWYSASSDGEDAFVDANVFDQFADIDDYEDQGTANTGTGSVNTTSLSDTNRSPEMPSTENAGQRPPPDDVGNCCSDDASLSSNTPSDQGAAQKFKWWTAQADSLVREQLLHQQLVVADGSNTVSAGINNRSIVPSTAEDGNADHVHTVAASIPRDRQCRAVRVRSWLRKHHHSRTFIETQEDTSCDASSEATSEADGGDADCGDANAEQEGCSRSLGSDDMSSSLATCHEMASVCTAHTLSAKVGSTQASPLKYRSRGTRRRTTQRPWSLHLPQPVSGCSGPHSLSVSETALNQVALTSAQYRAVGAANAALSSSVGSRLSKPSPAKWAGRRHSRLQQPIRNASTDSGGGSSVSGHTHRRSRRRSLRSLTSATDAATCHVTKSQSFCCSAALRENVSQLDASSSSNSSETGVRDSEVKQVDQDHAEQQQHSELCEVGHAEELSSMSEQAWDHYQEFKVINELDSEGSPDRDATRHLLECDDYRKFLDSQPEDCASSQLSGRNSTALYRRNSKPHTGADSPTKSSTRRPRRKARIFLPSRIDSDSDSNVTNSSISRLLFDSRGNLHVILQQIDSGTSDCAEFYESVQNQCQLEIARLEKAITLLQPLSSRDSTLFLSQLNEVVEQWRLLQQRAADQQHQADAVNRLHVRCSDLHSRLTRVDTDLTSLSDSPSQLNSIGQVNDRISQLKELQCSLTECCQSLTIINTDAHRHTNSTDKGATNSHCADNDAENCQSQDKLRTEIARLYLLVDKLSERLSGSLDWLESLQSVWSRYLSATEQVQAALEHDRQLLAGLQRQTGDSTTTTGHTPPPQSGHVRRKRGCLSDADREQLRQLSSLLNAPNQNPLLNGSYSLSGSRDDLSSEGTSGYDSACSDEMNTHAKRVGRLSRLASRLQTLLPPRSAAYNEVQQTVSSASTELQDLQLTCNKLITMTCVGESAVNTGSSPIPEASTATAPVSQCKRPFSWLRRVLRVALPFQLILLVCVCAACLLEPTCSGSGCRFHLSFEPQLRYLNGPPPI